MAKKVTAPGSRFNPLRTDPTRTGGIRLAFIKALRKRFSIIRTALVRLVLTEDAFGLKDRKPPSLAFNYYTPQVSVLNATAIEVSRALQAVAEMPTVPEAESTGRTGREVKNLLITVPTIEYDRAKGTVEKLRASKGSGKEAVMFSPEALAKVVSPQTVLVAETLTAILQRGTVLDDLQTPLAFYYKGKVYLANGNHRVVAALLLGRPIRIKVEAAITELAHLRQTVNEANVAYPNLTVNRRWEALQDFDKIKAFKDWLRQQFDAGLTGKSDEDLWRAYTLQGYRTGKGRAYTDVKAQAKSSATSLPPTQQQFLAQSLNRPASINAVKVLAGRAFNDLEGVTNDTSLRMSRVLTDGLVQGLSPAEMAKDLNEELDIGQRRSELIARTEVIRAHAEGQLDAMEEMGIEEVGVAVEWAVADDDNVCPLCEPLEGIVLKIDEARGMLPRHPACRCAWIPNVGDSDEATKDTKASITKAIRQSAKAGKDDFTPGRPVSKVRPEYAANSGFTFRMAGDPYLDFILNTFCPTGPGGGVDPSCHPHEGGTPTADKVSPKSTDKATPKSTDKSKFIGEKVGKAEHVHSQKVEQEITTAISGQWEEDNKFYDGKTSDDKHFLEIKSLLKGSKQALSVHPDALLRKVEGVKANPGSTFHTVAVDEREHYGGGEFKDKYSGNRLYYRRGSGRYSLSQMHPVKDLEELRQLLATPDRQLPAKAQGSLPKGAAVKALKEAAEKAHASRLEKDRSRKARLKSLGKG